LEFLKGSIEKFKKILGFNLDVKFYYQENNIGNKSIGIYTFDDTDSWFVEYSELAKENFFSHGERPFFLLIVREFANALFAIEKRSFIKKNECK
jgi:hypothetical protein